MSKYFKIPVFAILSSLLFSTQCDEDKPVTFEDDQADLIAFKTEIKNLVSTSICSDDFECQYIAFNSKPCGSAWEYLIYSTSINNDKLEAMVESYNAQEKDFNERWGIASDCAVVLPPTSISCENNICVAVN